MGYSPESAAIKRNYHRLSNRLHEPLELVIKLYSSDVITRSAREKFTASNSPLERKHTFLDELERSIELQPKNFDKFLEALQGDPALTELAQQLDEDCTAIKSLQGRQRSYSAPSSIPLRPSAAIHHNKDADVSSSCAQCPGAAAIILNPCQCKYCNGCIVMATTNCGLCNTPIREKEHMKRCSFCSQESVVVLEPCGCTICTDCSENPHENCSSCNTKVKNRRILNTKIFLHDPKVSPQTEAFKMVYSDLLKRVQYIAELEDRLSSDGIVPKDLDSSEVKLLKRKINLLDKIGSVITMHPEKFEEILSILENHVPGQLIAEMKFLQERFLAVDTAIPSRLPLCHIICYHNNDDGDVSDVHTSRYCVICPDPASFIASPCQCDFCEGCVHGVKVECPHCGSGVQGTIATRRPYSTVGSRPAGAATRRPYSTVGSRPADAATRRPYSTVGSRPAGAPTRRPYSTVGSRPADAATRRPYSTVGSRPADAATRRPYSTVGSKPASAAPGNSYSTIGTNRIHGFQSPTQLQSCGSHLQKVSKTKALAATASLSGLPVSRPASCEPASPEIKPLTCTTPELSSFVPGLARMATPFTATTHALHSVGSEMVQIHYIICQDMFSAPVKAKILPELNASTTLKDLYDCIMQVESISSDLTLEVFSHEGYPLHPNEFTSQCTLKQWGICNKDLLYIFIRRVHQPIASIVPTTPPLLPPQPHPRYEIDELVVESILSSRFTVKCCLNSEVAGSIYQKVSLVTGIPIPNMVLYTRKGFVALEKETSLAKLSNGSVLTLVLRSLRSHGQLPMGPLGIEYGAKTYIPYVEQSNCGTAKFFAILKFICSKQHEHVDIAKLITYLKMLTYCPPLVYALNILHEESYLKLPCWVALVEGCFQLFKGLLETFCSVGDYHVFEFSDYLWALLISQSKEIPSSDLVECEKTNLECPISQLKMVEPVILPGCLERFDKNSVMEKIKAKTLVPGSFKYLLTEEDIITDEVVARMLVYHPWQHEKHVYIWKGTVTVPQENQKIPKVEMPCSLNILTSKLPLLRIASPDGLCCGDESLTFIRNGQLVYFLGFCKTKECYRKVFNPVTCSCEYYDLHEMKSFAASKTAVSHDLLKFLKTWKAFPTFASYLKVLPSGQEEIVRWDPEEAIVVLLDGSGSMSSSVFQETTFLSSLKAAKDMFMAFANRSQAYGFHHSLGLTVFNTHFTVIQPLMRICECFKESLNKVTANGQTALYDAIMDAVDQLKKYTKENHKCKRRILCLSDGYDNSSHVLPHTVVNLLQNLSLNYQLHSSKQARRELDTFNIREKVAVDTVLIIESPSNHDLKAISHASGGTCFVPNSYCEALKLFEMETILSIRGRALPEQLPAVSAKEDLHLFQSLAAYPYNAGLLPSIFHEKFKYTMTTPINRFIVTESMVKDYCVDSCNKRILKELMDLKRHPHPAIDIFPCDSLLMWKIILKGPEGTPYENGAFVMTLEFPQSYPNKPPEARFVTPIYHCNINSSGRICHEVLTTGYTPSISVREILSFIYGLLMVPEPNEPLDTVLALEYHTNQEGFFLEAQRQTREHAGSNAAYLELTKEYTYNEGQTSGDVCVMVQVHTLEEKDGHIRSLQQANKALQQANDVLEQDLHQAKEDLKKAKEELTEKMDFLSNLIQANDDLNRQLEETRCSVPHAHLPFHD